MNKPHRGQNDGSIVEFSDGRKHPYQVRVTVAGGQQRTLGSFASITAARDALKKALGDQQRGLLPSAQDQTVAQFVAVWLQEVAAPRLKPRPLQNYQDIARLHVIPAIGALKVSKLTAQDLTRLYNAVGQKTNPRTGQPLSPKTVRNVHLFLHAMLSTALKWDIVARNVADAATTPRAPRTEQQALSAEQRAAFLAASRGDSLEALWLLALCTGARRGELLGLKWADLDAATGALKIQRSLARIAGHGLVEQEPKTPQSRRIVSLPAQVVEALKAHRSRQLQARLLAGPLWEDIGYVFAGPFGKPLDPDNVVHRLYKPLLAKAGLPALSFHALRHSNASWLFDEGADLKDVSAWLGHSRLSTTADIYVHPDATRRDALARKLSASLDSEASV